jgi:methylmalonyl-CoA carboxyltransferase large subunit
LTLITGIVAGGLTARHVARREVEALREQLKRRETAPPPPPLAPAPVAAAPAPAPVPRPEISEEITPEILMVLSAAVAAFLGKKAKIRRARLAGRAPQSNVWAQQGRVFVQASHNLPVHH